MTDCPTYREMVTTDGKFVAGAILTFAHRRARIEFDAHRAAGGSNLPTYAQLFARELRNAYGWASAIRGAGQGESPARLVPMFIRRAADIATAMGMRT